MNKKKHVLIGLVAVVILMVSFCHFVGDSEFPISALLNTPGTNPQMKVGKAPPPPPDFGAGAAGFLPTKMEDSEKFALLQKAFKDMGQCLKIQVEELDPQAEINLEYMTKVLSAPLGEISAQNEEWRATDLRTKEGEIRRIYLETIGNVSAESQRALKYYSMSPDGSEKEIPVETELRVNPSDTVISGLEADGTVTDRSVSRRIVFNSGDELVLVEKNGKIFSFSVPHEGKSFNCTGVDTGVNFKCECK